MYNSFHPRCIFLKTLPKDSLCLDMGAGDGTYTVYRKWPRPERRDIELYAVSLEKGVHFDDYDGYAIGDFEKTPDFFDGKIFDAIHASHFIEHLERRDVFMAWAKKRLKPGGRIYLEWPSRNAEATPKKADLAAIGMEDITIGNYYDDYTHRTYPANPGMSESLVKAGFRIDAGGIVSMPVFENELLACYKENRDRVALQFAYWLRTRWCEYCIASVPSENN